MHVLKKIFKPLSAIALALVLSIAPVVAENSVVTPTNMAGWAEDSTPPADVSFVNGPGDPPRGDGSAQFSVDASGASDAELRNDNYTGLRLDDIDQLTYSTYVQNNNNEQAVYIILNVDYDGNGVSDDLLFFEPVYQDSTFCSKDQGDVVLNTWQTWDALTGCWWSFNGTAGATPGTGVKTLAQILDAKPDATIAASVSPNGAVRLVAGFGGPGDWGNFLGNADAFTINGDTFDFELNSTPTSKDQCKDGGWQTFNPPQGTFKNQGDCVSFVATDGRNQPSGPAITPDGEDGEDGEIDSTTNHRSADEDKDEEQTTTQSTSQNGRHQAPGQQKKHDSRF